MRKSLLITLLLLHSIQNSYAQDTVWSLQRCMDYAAENNLSIRQSELEKKQSEINLQGAKMNYYPTLNLSSNYGLNLGRSINPTTNQFENTQFSSSGLSASSNILLFGWFQKKYAVQKTNLQVQQTNENYEQLKDDIALNISTAYLSALLAKEQINNIAYQIEISKSNQTRVKRLLELGKSNVLEYAQSQSQVATDSSLYFQAKLNYEQSLIELKTLLHLDYKKKIAIDTSSVEDLYFIEKLNPEAIYTYAQNNYHSIKASGYSLEIAQKDLQISKASSLPQLNLYYSAGSNYSTSFYEYLPSGEKRLMNFGKQLNTNFSQSIGLGLSIPIFNNLSAKNAIKSAKINVQKSEFVNQASKQKLENAIFTACTDYEVSLQKFKNNRNLLGYSKTAFEAAKVRYEAGFINNFEYLTEKNNFLKAQNEASGSKYELWFKKMLIGYFKSGKMLGRY